MTPRIVVVGSFVVGLTIRVPRPPVLGEGLIGDLFDMGPGGKGTNQAIAAARQGAHVDLVACVGDDIFAEIAMRLYQREQIAGDHIHRIPNVNTGVGFVTLLPSGENSIVGHLGANMHMRPEHVDAAESLIAQSHVVITQYEVPEETVARALELGHKTRQTDDLESCPGKGIRPGHAEARGFVDAQRVGDADLARPAARTIRRPRSNLPRACSTSGSNAWW